MINDRDESELIRAIYEKDFNLFNQLLETNVNVNWQNSELETVLMITVSRPAIEEDAATMVGNLIAKGADVDIRDKKSSN
jgi:ankyrin repeat protein